MATKTHPLDHLSGDALFSAVQDVLKTICSSRPPRPVVTRSGHRARGNFPARKCPETCRYESLVELDAWRVLEACPEVHRIWTHPFVLNVESPAGKSTYTPDAFIQLNAGGLLVEVKADGLYGLSKNRNRHRMLFDFLAKNGIRLALLLESDLRASGLASRVEAVLKDRPGLPRHRPRRDLNMWDPLMLSPPCQEDLERWAVAQQECSELLKRVMRRNPGDSEALVATN